MKRPVDKSTIKQIISVFVAVAVIIITDYLSEVKTVKTNKTDIALLQQSSISYKDFNEFVKAQNEINILLQERQKILIDDVGSLKKIDDKLKEEIHRLDKMIERINSKNEERMNKYGMKTRDGKEVKISLDWLIKEIPET
jgi:cell division protein ZapA (FtsZ GTPase activity inhibitor)